MRVLHVRAVSFFAPQRKRHVSCCRWNDGAGRMRACMHARMHARTHACTHTRTHTRLTTTFVVRRIEAMVVGRAAEKIQISTRRQAHQQGRRPARVLRGLAAEQRPTGQVIIIKAANESGSGVVVVVEQVVVEQVVVEKVVNEAIFPVPGLQGLQKTAQQQVRNRVQCEPVDQRQCRSGHDEDCEEYTWMEPPHVAVRMGTRPATRAFHR